MKAHFLIRLQLDGLELINYEDAEHLMQFSSPHSLTLRLHRHIARSFVRSRWAELPSCGNALLQQIMHEHEHTSLQVIATICICL